MPFVLKHSQMRPFVPMFFPNLNLKGYQYSKKATDQNKFHSLIHQQEISFHSLIHQQEISLQAQ